MSYKRKTKLKKKKKIFKLLSLVALEFCEIVFKVKYICAADIYKVMGSCDLDFLGITYSFDFISFFHVFQINNAIGSSFHVYFLGINSDIFTCIIQINDLWEGI